MAFTQSNKQRYWGQDWRQLEAARYFEAPLDEIADIIRYTEAAWSFITVEEDRVTWDNSGFETFAAVVVVERDKSRLEEETVVHKSAIVIPNPTTTVDNTRWFVTVKGPWGAYRYPMLDDLVEHPEDSGIQLLLDPSDPDSWSEPRPVFTEAELKTFYAT